MPDGFLNRMRDDDFQALMRSWATLGPYHAVDLMLLETAADVARWRDVIDAALVKHGFSAGARLCEYPCADDAVRDEMNEMFPGDGQPFRFFVARDNGGHWLGLVWDHWVSDSVTIREIMRRLHAGFLELEMPPSLRRIEPPRAASPLAALTALAANYRRHRRAYRVPLGSPLDLRVGTWRADSPPGTVRLLRECARSLHVTLNDLFLAALAQTAGSWTAAGRASVRQRNEVGIGVAVNTRPYFPANLSDGFGFYLSSFSLVERAPEAAAWPDLVRRIATKTHHMKRTREALRMTAACRAGRWLWNCARRPETRALLIHRGAPVVAGISNVTLDGEWPAAAEKLVHYRRYSPTGPLTPLVFVPTTLRGRLELTLTYRLCALSETTAAELGRDFINRVTAMAQTVPTAAPATTSDG